MCGSGDPCEWELLPTSPELLEQSPHLVCRNGHVRTEAGTILIPDHRTRTHTVRRCRACYHISLRRTADRRRMLCRNCGGQRPAKAKLPLCQECLAAELATMTQGKKIYEKRGEW